MRKFNENLAGPQDIDEQKKDNELRMIHISLKSRRTDTNIFKEYTVINSIHYPAIFIKMTKYVIS